MSTDPLDVVDTVVPELESAVEDVRRTFAKLNAARTHPLQPVAQAMQMECAMTDDITKALELAHKVLEMVDGCAETEWEDEHRLARALLAMHAEVERTKAVMNEYHALLCVVTLMDESDTTHRVKVFRESMPSLRRLFRGDEHTLYLYTAVDRALDAPGTGKAGR